mmetsp:Transcript_924/g.3293  ORF Transcript_924/g.3293 Transcript_924/m.3293 type:complete len:212 (-) Transcript_924:166-801(-)
MHTASLVCVSERRVELLELERALSLRNVFVVPDVGVRALVDPSVIRRVEEALAHFDDLAALPAAVRGGARHAGQRRRQAEHGRVLAGRARPAALGRRQAQVEARVHTVPPRRAEFAVLWGLRADEIIKFAGGAVSRALRRLQAHRRTVAAARARDALGAPRPARPVRPARAGRALRLGLARRVAPEPRVRTDTSRQSSRQQRRQHAPPRPA